MKGTLTGALLVVTVSLPALAQFDCSQQKYSSSIAGGNTTINITAGTGWNGSPTSVLNGAINYWSSACLQFGAGFPMMCMGCSSSGYPVTVNYNPGSGVRCGTHQAYLLNGAPFGSEITLYGSSGGHSCEPIEDALAHELGHVLGLDDVTYAASCFGSIMGARAPGGTRTVTEDDCDTADDSWETDNEEPPPDDDPVPYVPLEVGLGDPLILDLNGDGVHTTSLAWPVAFDMMGDGERITMAWTDAATEEAFLWIDLVANHRVDDGRELFGTGTVLPSGERARDGFEALGVYDAAQHGGNGDGVIDRHDTIWSRLRLWVDRNHDGASTPDELRPIHESRVVAIDLPSVPALTALRDNHGNLHVIRTRYWIRDGHQIFAREIHNVEFVVADR